MADGLIFAEDERREAVALALDTVGLQHVSATQLGMYRRCPRQWAFRYVLGLKNPPDGGLVVGSGVHAAAEIGMKAKMDGGGNPKPDDSASLAADYVAGEFKNGEVSLEEGQKQGDLVDKAARVASMWAGLAAPAVNPISVEDRFDVEIAGITVTGRLDVTTKDVVIDWKTSGRSPNADDLGRKPQTELYAMATGKPVTYVYLVDSARTQKVVPVELDDYVIERAKQMAYSSVADVSEGMALGVWPRNRDGWHCSRRWCGYYERCMAGKDDAVLRERAVEARAAAGISW
jgi:hypothetical protein